MLQRTGCLHSPKAVQYNSFNMQCVPHIVRNKFNKTLNRAHIAYAPNASYYRYFSPGSNVGAPWPICTIRWRRSFDDRSHPYVNEVTGHWMFARVLLCCALGICSRKGCFLTWELSWAKPEAWKAKTWNWPKNKKTKSIWKCHKKDSGQLIWNPQYIYYRFFFSFLELLREFQCLCCFVSFI